MLAPMRRGFSLPELLLALAVLGLLFGIVLPRFGLFRDQLAVAEEAGRVAAAHRRARIAAILESRPVILTIAPESLTIAVDSVPGTLWSEPGPSLHGVALSGGARALTFSPVGISTGLSNATFRFTRGAAVRTVVVSRLGRLRMF
jgi:prepilin-type N-terminal cleavage/methylation domain-containing protein